MANLFASENLASPIEAVNPGQLTVGRPVHGAITGALLGVTTFGGYLTSYTISSITSGFVTYGSIQGFVPYSGANSNVNLGIYDLSADIVTSNKITLNSSNQTLGIGEIGFSGLNTEITFGLDNGLSYHPGFDTICRVYNSSGSILTPGKIVYVTTRVSGDLPGVNVADCNTYNKSLTIGIVETTIGIAQSGYIHTLGEISLDTSSFNSGDRLYLGNSGIMTNLIPSPPNFVVFLGTVTYANSNGRMQFSPVNFGQLYNPNQIVFGAANGFGTNDTNLVYSNSKFGIGTQSATQSLHVVGSARITGAIYDSNNSSGTSGLVLSSTQSGTAWTTQSGGVQGSGVANQIVYWSGSNTITGNTLFTINGFGSVGVNTTVPLAMFHCHASDIRVNKVMFGLGGGYIISNLAIGPGALQSGSSNYNIAIGQNALNSIAVSNDNGNVAIGAYALSTQSGGGSNVGIGSAALLTNTTGSSNVAIGNAALINNTSSNNVAIGAGALSGVAGGVTSNNIVAVGRNAAQNIVASPSSVYIGDSAGKNINNLVGQNVIIGASALSTTSVTGVNQSVIIGYSAGLQYSGAGGVIIGSLANQGVSNASGTIVFIGNAAGRYATNAGNTFIGATAGQGSSTTSLTGQNNTAIGNAALTAGSTAASNVVVGAAAAPSLTSGGNNTILGAAADVLATGSRQIAIGQGVIPTASNLGAFGGQTSGTRTDLGIGTFTPIARTHIETLAAGNKGLYIAGFASQTANLIQVDATTSGTQFFSIGPAGQYGFGNSVAAVSTGWASSSSTLNKTLTDSSTTTDVRNFVAALASELLSHGILKP